MAERPLVSIVTANYNGAAFLPAAARAVLAQTLGDFEWIVADDASTDDSGAVIAQVTGGDPRVRFLTAERNGGPAGARNRALAAARGRWIAVFDSDDEMAPERLELIQCFSDPQGGISVHPMVPTWPRETLSRTTFTERAGKTTMELRWSVWNGTDEEHATVDAAHGGMSQGWGGTMDRLVTYLANA